MGESKYPHNWTLQRLSDDCVVKGRIGWRGYKTSDLRDFGPVVLGGLNVKSNYHLELSDMKHLSREKFDESPDIILKNGDVLVVTRGNGLGDIGYYNGYPIEATINPSLVILSEYNGNPKFLFYFLISRQGQVLLESLRSGSSIPAIYQKSLRLLQYPKPPRQIQDEIVDILQPLDDKIEANRRMNETLENTARAIFKSWFVDFDPVHAKANGEIPEGMSAETADLFPDDFQESELGLIPRGWGVGQIDDLLMLEKNSVKPQSFPDEDFLHFSIPAYLASELPVIEKGEEIKSNKHYLSGNCVLISKLNPRFHKVWLPDIQNTDLRPITSTEFLIAVPTKHASKEYLYTLFWMPKFIGDYRSLVTGTSSSHQRVKWQSFLKMRTLLSPVEVVEKFTSICSDMYNRVHANKRENQTLTELRDTLLPRLISGELRVEDVSEFVGDV